MGTYKFSTKRVRGPADRDLQTGTCRGGPESTQRHRGPADGTCRTCRWSTQRDREPADGDLGELQTGACGAIRAHSGTRLVGGNRAGKYFAGMDLA